jgi:hypothetical protein
MNAVPSHPQVIVFMIPLDMHVFAEVLKACGRMLIGNSRAEIVFEQYRVEYMTVVG